MSDHFKAIELFSGAGGLALGVSKAGFKHEAVVEFNRNACQTIRLNKNHPDVNDWALHEMDVREFCYSQLGRVDLVSGGPPCQPFSLGGRHRGQNDNRDMFPEAIRAVRETRPKAILIENVKGLLRESFADYFEFITLQLTYPEVGRTEGEDWKSHLTRLEKHHTKGGARGLTYNVVYRLVNAADYGVPQKRERVVIVGIRSDLGLEFSFPEPTHSQEALVWEQCITGDYWERHGIARKNRPEVTPRIASIANKLNGLLIPPETQSWRTVRDAFVGLPHPAAPGASAFSNHVFYGGARAYPGHTGSEFDQPAKTLKAGDHGVPGGENMLVDVDGSLRYFSVRESARLQTFPDDYEFWGRWTIAMKQLGNAVPVQLAQVMASRLRECLTVAS